MCYPEVQKWFKRVRKIHPQAVRYVTVLEHGSLFGRLHYHSILTGTSEIVYRDLHATWTGGHSEMKLIKKTDSRNYAGYIASYIAKSAIRIRATSNRKGSKRSPPSYAWGMGYEGIPF